MFIPYSGEIGENEGNISFNDMNISSSVFRYLLHSICCLASHFHFDLENRRGKNRPKIIDEQLKIYL